MASSDEPQRRRSPKADTIFGRENQLISAAMDLAEQQIQAGTASSQVITHFLKLGTVREGLERAKIEHETELLRAKQTHLENQESLDALFTEAMEAFRTYNGSDQ